MRNNLTYIRVQTNSLPSHCYQTATPPQENQIDIETYFNPTYLNPNPVVISSQATLDAQVCDFSWPQTDSAPQGYTHFLGNVTGVVGISFTGVPIMDGNSEFDLDPFYPKPNVPGAQLQTLSDFCLGSVTSQVPWYHYSSFSPCMSTSPQQLSSQSQACSSFQNCATATSSYMTSGVQKILQAVGIALDGHIIYGPWKDTSNLWGYCDVDVCNGLQVNGAYGYAMTTFHPYTVGCWGPGNQPHIQQSCSTNPNKCTP